MDDEAAPDGLRAADDDAREEAAEVRADAPGQRLAEMNGAIKSSHGKGGSRDSTADVL